MATSKVQRYGILIIVAATVIGTLGSFAVLILDTQTRSEEQAKNQSAMAKYTEIQKDYQAKIKEQADQLSKQYYSTLASYESEPAEFGINSVEALTTDDIVVGDGELIDGTTSFAAYYIGWDANGRVFDQSIDTSTHTLKPPLYYNDPQSGASGLIEGLDKASLISGWKTGMKGMHVGGIRLISIPSDQAYGVAGSGSSIAPNMPLKFIVMAIPAPTPVPQADISKLLEQLQGTQQ